MVTMRWPQYTATKKVMKYSRMMIGPEGLIYKQKYKVLNRLPQEKHIEIVKPVA